MMHRLHALLAALVSILPARLEPVDGESLRCSMVLSPGLHSRTETIVLATGSADTQLVGPGGVEPGRGGHSGTGEPGRIYGQVFEVSRFSGADSVLLARAFSQLRNKRAVIVPWDYDASCRPSRWTSGFAWVAVATPGTFTVELRPDSLWVNGLPVFDAFAAAFEPYPSSRTYRENRRHLSRFTTTEELSAEHFFDMLSAAPTSEDIREHPDSAWRMFTSWQAANPELAQMYPAKELESWFSNQVTWTKERRVLRRIDPVIAGTYRMSVSLNGGPDRSFYVRTWPWPHDEWHPKNEQRPASSDPLDEPPRPEAYSVYASGAPSMETLIEGCRQRGPLRREGYMYVIDPARPADKHRTEWRGWIEVGLISAQFPEDSTLVRFHRRAFDEWASRWNTAEELEAPARFWLDGDSVLRVEQRTVLRDGPSLVLRGERVASDVIACDAF